MYFHTPALETLQETLSYLSFMWRTGLNKRQNIYAKLGDIYANSKEEKRLSQACLANLFFGTLNIKGRVGNFREASNSKPALKAQDLTLPSEPKPRVAIRYQLV